MKYQASTILLFIVGFAFTTATSAQATQIPWGYTEVASQYHIPTELLYAIALNESGAKLQSSVIKPWPWTLNVNGKPHRYATRRQATKALKSYLTQGITNIDIGVMQVNWKYHQRQLLDPSLALDPYFNLDVGAGLLQHEHHLNANWLMAAGHYHSPGTRWYQQQEARKYQAGIQRTLITLKDKN